VLEDSLVGRLRRLPVDVEPVEIAVEDERRALAPRHGKDRFERERLPVESADVFRAMAP